MSTPKAVRDYLAAIGAKGGAAGTPAQQAQREAAAKLGGRPKGSKDSKPRKRRSPANTKSQS